MSPPPLQDRRRRLYQAGALLVTIALLLAVAVAVLTSGSTSDLAPGKPVPGAPATLALLAGIPQHGGALGNPRARVTLIEVGDLQCPSCAIFAQEALPSVISRYVRPGRVQLRFAPLTSIGGDSQRAARMAVAIGEQNRLWQFIDLMYRNQGAENTSYVTDTYLRALAGAIPGVDVPRALAARNTAAVQTQIDQAAALARRSHISGTPSFIISSGGGQPHKLSLSTPSAEALATALDHALAGTSA